MTVTEILFDFDLKFDRIASQSKADINIAEKIWLLNEARWVLLNQAYGISNQFVAAFEQNQKRIDDLSNLHIKYPVQPALIPIVIDNIYEVPLSNLKYPYLFLTRAYAKVNGCDNIVPLSPVENDDLSNAVDNPFITKKDFIPVNFGRGTTEDKPSLFIYPTTDVVDKVYIEYMKHPQRIQSDKYTYIDGIVYPETNTDLPEHLHPKLVDIAVDIAAGITDNAKYQQFKSLKKFEYN